MGKLNSLTLFGDFTVLLMAKRDQCCKRETWPLLYGTRQQDFPNCGSRTVVWSFDILRVDHSGPGYLCNLKVSKINLRFLKVSKIEYLSFSRSIWQFVHWHFTPNTLYSIQQLWLWKITPHNIQLYMLQNANLLKSIMSLFTWIVNTPPYKLKKKLRFTYPISRDSFQ